MTVWGPVTPAFVIPANYLITLRHGYLLSICFPNTRVPEACAYSYQKYPKSVQSALPASFEEGLAELNGGLQIFKPSLEKFQRIYHVLNTGKPNEFLFADQSLLSKTFHKTWTSLYVLPMCED
jgi:hypothetical protein